MEMPKSAWSITSVGELSSLLNVEVKRLNFLAYGANSKAKLYFNFGIPKRAGGVRQISAPISELKNVQRKIAQLCHEVYQPKACVHGFVGGRSFASNARRHVRQRWVGSVDLRDFFPSINYGRIRGLFLKAPFDLPEPVANLLAALCTHDGALPQGAPTSPVLSNLICRQLDRQVGLLARKNNCIYTRYADDLVFSSNRSKFPSSILRESEDSTSYFVGPQLAAVIGSAGFVVNEGKVRLRSRAARQLVTGCVVNSHVNVTREYKRELRSLLYVWKTYGLAPAIAHAKDRGFLHESVKGEVTLGAFVRGKLAHLRGLRGADDVTYQRLAYEYTLIDGVGFAAGKPQPKKMRLRLMVEGPSDASHLKAALLDLQNQGSFQDLEFEAITSVGGGADLSKVITTLEKAPPDVLTLCVFDSDDKAFYGKYVPTGSSHAVIHSTLSVVLVRPPAFRADYDVACIELLYRDEDLLKWSAQGRRIFLRREFEQPHCFHKSGPFIRQGASGMGLVVDSSVFHLETKEQVALSKVEFAKAVEAREEPFDAMGSEGFSELFALFRIAAEEASHFPPSASV